MSRVPPIVSGPTPRIFSIGPQLPFLDELAKAVIDIAGGDPAAMADVEIFLPTRRAVRALGDCFLARAGAGGAIVLPKIRAVGDVDEDETVLFKGAAVDELELPPAVSSIERRITLARFVYAREQATAGRAHWASALAAADELALLLDSFYTEEIDPAMLSSIAPDDLAAHWAQSLDFLKIVTHSWPTFLEETNRMDPAARRVQLISRLAESYRANPPDHPVIIAGTTGSAPAVARLLDVIARLPKGCALLPGLDLTMDEATWDAVDDPHPQSGLKHLLEHGLNLDRGSVRAWPFEREEQSTLRTDVVNVALRPAAATDSWKDWAEGFRVRGSELEDALADMSLIEMDDEEREADAIAIAIRGTVEQSGRTVSLVTPDRDLSRRVSGKLKRWGILVDDSAGVPFANTRCGVFLRLVARLISDGADPAAYAAVMGHALFGGGVADDKRPAMIAEGDLALRGLKPESIDGVAEQLSGAGAFSEELSALVEAVRAASGELSFAARLSAHVTLAETFAATETQRGADLLWRGEDGEAGAARIADLADAVASIEQSSALEYHEMFDQLIAGVAVRRRAPSHPRVSIFGPLEARLQTADVLILGGLNEGVWPRDAAIDGFLSRGMRKTVGLPSPERRVGLSAHDFAQLSAAPTVMLTRAKKAGGKPATASRWIIRLKNILNGAHVLEAVDRSEYYARLAERLDEAPYAPVRAEPPRPPVAARPARFSVTRIETLIRDPYSIYGGLILRLAKLDDFNERADQRHIGNLFHALFEQLVLEEAPRDSSAALARLISMFEEQASGPGLGAAHLPFWRERARAAFEWFAEWDAARRSEGAPAVIEERGVWDFEHQGQEYTLSAKADRIDRLNTGGVAIFDYKTGAPPPTDKQQSKFSPQLPLTALIVREGGFANLGAAHVERFAYLKVLNRKPGEPNETNAQGEKCEAAMAEAEAGLKTLLAHFNNPETTYPSQPRPQFIREYGDYDHLARRGENRSQEGTE